MRDKRCRQVKPYLSRYVDGELSPEENKFVSAHLESCLHCRDIVENLRSASRRLSDAFAEVDAAEFAGSAAKRLMGSLPKEPGNRKPLFLPVRWGRPPSWRFAAGVVVLLICIGSLGVSSLQNMRDTKVRAKVSRAESTEESTGYRFLRAGKEVAAGREMSDKKLKSLGYVGEGVRTECGQMAAGAYVTASMSDSLSAVNGQPPETKQENPRVADQRKVIRNAKIEIVAEDVLDAKERAEALCTQRGGLIAGVSVSQDRSSPWARLTLWVPSEDLDRVLDELSLLGEVRQITLESTDITEQYFDLETRVRNLRIQEERLLTLYEREVKKLDEILKVEQEIQRVRTEIERLEGRKRLWDRQVDLSVVEVQLTQKPEKEPIALSQPDDVLSPLRRAIRDTASVFLYSCSIITACISWILASITFIIPWLLIGLLIWIGAKGVLRARGGQSK